MHSSKKARLKHGRYQTTPKQHFPFLQFITAKVKQQIIKRKMLCSPKNDWITFLDWLGSR